MPLWRTKGWAIECDPNEYLIAKVRVYLYASFTYIALSPSHTHTRSRSPSLSVPFGDCVNIDMMCVREATKSVRRWGILLRLFVFLYAFTLPHFIVDYIIRNDLFVPSSIYRQGISTHTWQEKNLWHSIWICNCECCKWSKSFWQSIMMQMKTTKL